jgi:hypothetical protein
LTLACRRCCLTAGKRSETRISQRGGIQHDLLDAVEI